MSSWFKSKISGIKEWYSSQDTQQNITVITSFASDAFKVVMASLLCVFVPQACTIEESNRDIFTKTFGIEMPSEINHINGTRITTHVCSFQENFTNLIDFNSFVLAFNFLTLGYFTYLYAVELRREKWMIDHLDYNKEKTDDNILTLKESYPKIMEQLQLHNVKYMRTYKYLHVIYVMNFLFSAVLVLYYYYFDYRTATTLVTNTILCSNKIRIGRQLAIQSAKKEYAYSFYNNKNISFNVIDPRLASLEPDDNLETNTLGSDVIENGVIENGVIENGVIETDLDTVYSSNIQNKIDKNSNSKENLHKQLTGIRKYINSF
jgi:hypothetical protein